MITYIFLIAYFSYTKVEYICFMFQQTKGLDVMILCEINHFVLIK